MSTTDLYPPCQKLFREQQQGERCIFLSKYKCKFFCFRFGTAKGKTRLGCYIAPVHLHRHSGFPPKPWVLNILGCHIIYQGEHVNIKANWWGFKVIFVYKENSPHNSLVQFCMPFKHDMVFCSSLFSKRKKQLLSFPLEMQSQLPIIWKWECERISATITSQGIFFFGAYSFSSMARSLLVLQDRMVYQDLFPPVLHE